MHSHERKYTYLCSRFLEDKTFSRFEVYVCSVRCCFPCEEIVQQ